MLHEKINSDQISARMCYNNLLKPKIKKLKKKKSGKYEKLKMIIIEKKLQQYGIEKKP